MHNKFDLLNEILPIDNAISNKNTRAFNKIAVSVDVHRILRLFQTFY